MHTSSIRISCALLLHQTEWVRDTPHILLSLDNHSLSINLSSLHRSRLDSPDGVSTLYCLSSYSYNVGGNILSCGRPLIQNQILKITVRFSHRKALLHTELPSKLKGSLCCSPARNLCFENSSPSVPNQLHSVFVSPCKPGHLSVQRLCANCNRHHANVAG